MGEYLEQQYEERDYALELAKKHNLLPDDNSNLTWEELKDKAKEIGYFLSKDYQNDEFLSKRIGEKFYCFRQEGAVDNGQYYGIIAEHRTPSQMLAIMKALQ